MKKNAIEEIEKDIYEKTKLPYEVKDKIKKEVFTNIIIASIIIIYFIFVVLGSAGAIKNVRTIDLNIFSIIYLGIAIILFEIAYRKDSGYIAAFGMESLVVAVFTLFLPYIIFELDETRKKYYLLSTVYIGAYYILKSILISTKIRAKYMNGISDVKDIVKKEKVKRKNKDEYEEVEEKEKTEKIEKTEEVKIKEEPFKEKNKSDIADKPLKKRGRPKKVEDKNSDIENKIENAPKKRGRPKKTENNKIVKQQETSRVEHKKRGRPRKVVTSND